MRIRQVKPEFWRDRDVATLTPTTRLTYIGLWMLADDDGWFRYDPPLIALELYGWEAVDQREAAVAAALDDLRTAGRINVSECGKHAIVPTLVNHQRFAGETKKVHTFKREHDKCPRTPAGVPQTPAGDPHPPATVSGEGRNGSSRSVSSDARKREDESTTDWEARVAETLARSPIR